MRNGKGGGSYLNIGQLKCRFWRTKTGNIHVRNSIVFDLNPARQERLALPEFTLPAIPLRAAQQCHWHAPCAPSTRLVLEPARDLMAAKGATVALEIPLAEHVPIALDKAFATARAPRATALSVVDVTCVNIVQTLRECDPSGARERAMRRARLSSILKSG